MLQDKIANHLAHWSGYLWCFCLLYFSYILGLEKHVIPTNLCGNWLCIWITFVSHFFINHFLNKLKCHLFYLGNMNYIKFYIGNKKGNKGPLGVHRCSQLCKQCLTALKLVFKLILPLYPHATSLLSSTSSFKKDLVPTLLYCCVKHKLRPGDIISNQKD